MRKPHWPLAFNLAAPEGTSSRDWQDVFHWQEGTAQPRQVTLAGMGDIETTSIYCVLTSTRAKDSWHNLNVVQHVEEEAALDATAHAGT